jgi:hypothetical protein
MSRGSILRKTHFALLSVLVCVFLIAVFTTCGGSGGFGGSYKIKMTTENNKVELYLAGSGIATVDWGDGSEKVSLTLDETGNHGRGLRFAHEYATASIRTITINGDNITKYYHNSDKVTSLDVSRATTLTSLDVTTYAYEENTFTSLDVSKNIALTWLGVSGKFKSLDVSKNTTLTTLGVFSTQLTNLDVSKNTELMQLSITGGNENGKLTSLDVS